jgi:hypothetical protein
LLNTGGSKQGKQQPTTGAKTGPAVTGNVANTGGSGLGAVLDSGIMNQSHNIGEVAGPKTWSERLISSGKGRDVKLTDKIAHLWNEIVKSVYNKYVEKGIINKDNEPGFHEHALTKNSFMVNLNREIMSR